MTSVETVPPVIEPEAEEVEGRFYITGELNGETAEKVIRALYDFDSCYPLGPWTVVITSEGGYLESGIAIYSELLTYSKQGGGNHTVTTLVRGHAASGASLVLQAGDERVGGELDQLMIHEPIFSCEDKRLVDVKDAVVRMDLYHQQFIDICMKRCTLAREDFVGRIRGDWWMSSAEAVEIGLLDRIA